MDQSKTILELSIKIDSLTTQNEILKKEIDSMKENVLIESMNSMKEEMETILEKHKNTIDGYKLLAKWFRKQCWNFSVTMEMYNKILQDSLTLNEWNKCVIHKKMCEKSQDEFRWLEENFSKQIESCIEEHCGGCDFIFCQKYEQSDCECDHQ